MTIEELLSEAGPDAILITAGQVIAYANGAAHKLLSALPGKLVGRELATLLAPGELPRIQTVLQQRRRGFADLPQTYRLRFLKDHGEVAVDARFIEHGDQLVLTGRDATEQVRAQRLTGRLAELSRGGHNLFGADSLLDAAEPIFIELGWRGALVQFVESGSITLRAVACPPGDPIGAYVKTIAGRVLPLERTPVVHQVVTGGHALYLDNVPTFLSGPVSAAVPLSKSMEEGHVYRSAWCPVRTGKGELTHLLAVGGSGITEHDFVALQLFAGQVGAAIDLGRLRAELVQRERLAAVGEMAAVLAHEVRNPLGVVFNAVSGLRRQRLTGDAQVLLDSLGEEAERLRRLTVDLLDFARPAAPACGALPLEPLLRDAVKAAERDPSLQSDARPAVSIVVEPGASEVWADGMMLRRAVLNLVVNALQHASPSGAVEVKGALEADRIKVRVFNEGPPLAPELADQIFEPFFTTRAAGAGLGLAVVRRVMEDLGGVVTVEPCESGVAFALLLAPRPASEHRDSTADSSAVPKQ